MPSQSVSKYAVYIANAGSGDVTQLVLDADHSTLETVATLPAGKKPGAHVISPDHKYLYVATRGDNHICRFAIDAGTGNLTLLNKTDIGSSLVSLDIDNSGRYLIGSSYAENRVVSFDTADLAEPQAQPLASLQDIAKPHSVKLSKDDRFVSVASLGSDRVLTFALDEKGSLSEVGSVFVEDNFGPRHQSLSSDGSRLYVVSEFKGKVASFAYDTHAGSLTLEKISDFPDALGNLKEGFADAAGTEQGTAGLIWSADIHGTPDDRFLFISDRTASLLITLNQELESVAEAETEKQTRAFAVTPDGKFIVACGEKSDQARLHLINTDGSLDVADRAEVGQGANWVTVLPL